MQFERKNLDSLWPLADAKGLSYGEKPNGYISFGDVSLNLLDKQCQYGSRLITGRIEGYPALGKGLRFSGLDARGGNYHEIGIHPEDIDEFLRRYEAYSAFRQGFVHDEEGNEYELDEASTETLRIFLENIGAFDSWD